MNPWGPGGRHTPSSVLFGAVLIVLTMMAAACGSSSTGALAFGDNVVATADDPTRPQLSRDLVDSSEQFVEATTTTTTMSVVAADTPIDPINAVSTLIATATPEVTHLVAYDSPGGSIIPFEFAVPNPHQFGSPQVLMVTEGEPGDDWVQVQLPIRPNGQLGWIDASLYEFSRTQVRAEVNLSDRSVVVYDGSEILAQTRAVVGSSTYPTPLGTFFVTAKRRNPPSESYIGPWGLALSAFSEVHQTFDGGLPVIAIHGTNRPDQVGQARSNGCIRIPNDVVTFLAENVPLGTPVTISA